MRLPIDLHDKWYDLAGLAKAGRRLSARDGLSILRADEVAVPALLGAAHLVRHQFFGNTVKLCMLVNAQCGQCSEDCAYCAQSRVATADIAKHPLLAREQLVAAARNAAL